MTEYKLFRIPFYWSVYEVSSTNKQEAKLELIKRILDIPNDRIYENGLADLPIVQITKEVRDV